jgi:hypothetical protein
MAAKRLRADTRTRARARLQHRVAAKRVRVLLRVFLRLRFRSSSSCGGGACDRFGAPRLLLGALRLLRQKRVQRDLAFTLAVRGVTWRERSGCAHEQARKQNGRGQ